MRYSKQKWLSSASLLMGLALASPAALSSETTAIENQDCLFYLGEDAETLAAHQEASAARRLGLKLGLSVRKRQAAQWLRGYQLGYATAKDEEVSQTSDEISKSLDSFCGENRESTLLNAAQVLISGNG